VRARMPISGGGLSACIRNLKPEALKSRNYFLRAALTAHHAAVSNRR